MNPAKHGRDVRSSMEILQAAGYATTPASLGGFDVVAISSTDIVLCKIADEPPRPWSIDELQRIPAPSNARRIVHIWNSRRQLPECVEL